MNTCTVSSRAPALIRAGGQALRLRCGTSSEVVFLPVVCGFEVA
jgi:hypothetical protein